MNWLLSRLIPCWLLMAVARGDSSHVVINEIMYHPPGDLDLLQFIELYNPGKAECDLSGWGITKGVKVVFPKPTKLAPGGFLLVVRDRAAFGGHYGKELPIAGEFVGNLSHNGERIELSDAEGKVIETVKYADAAPWPMAADGHSSSVERICPFSPADEASNWAASNIPDLETPAGTPGRANDSFSANPPPVIGGVILTPAMPRPAQATIVEALVTDGDGVKAVEMTYQVATAGSLAEPLSLAMKRVSGDANKGRYRATLPAQPAGRLVRYRFRAIDAAGTARNSPEANDLRGAWSYSTFTNDNTSKVPFGFILRPGSAPLRGKPRGFGAPIQKTTRGRDAFVYLPAGGGEVHLFDFIQAPRRKGGYKVRFLKDQTLRGMTSINIVFEDSPRYALSEALSYELYRLAGVPAEMTEHIRLWVDGECRGYHLLVEQPNKSFLARNDRNTNGNLYKLIWYGEGVIGKHEKKSNQTNGHDDLIAAINGLKNLSGGDQWAFIQQHFNVEEFINYFAVNMCIQNWDGFHNNFFIYHDTEGTGLWEIYPWDEDKTWGDYDGASPRYDWYKLPLSFGMDGDQRPDSLGGPAAGNSFRGWWRAPGFFSGPLLANPQFRERFLVRLRQVCATIFTEEKVFPLINAMESRLEKEVPIRAQSNHEDTAQAVARFHSDMQSFRDQVTYRRKFVLDELDKLKR